MTGTPVVGSDADGPARGAAVRGTAAPAGDAGKRNQFLTVEKDG